MYYGINPEVAFINLLAIIFVCLTFLFILCKFLDRGKVEKRIQDIEVSALNKVCSDKGIDIHKEIAKERIQQSSKFRKKLEKEMVTAFFGDKKEDETP